MSNVGDSIRVIQLSTDWEDKREMILLATAYSVFLSGTHKQFYIVCLVRLYNRYTVYTVNYELCTMYSNIYAQMNRRSFGSATSIIIATAHHVQH